MNKNIYFFITILILVTIYHEFKVKKTPGTSLNEIVFATSAEYPPFEYQRNGEIIGFDIDIAHAIAQQLGKKATFKNMTFSSILPALSNHMADAAIATISVTTNREKNFDFSIPYYYETMAIISKKGNSLYDQNDLTDIITGCQLATSMEQWLKQHANKKNIILFDNNNIAIEAIKAGHIQAIVMDKVQAITFCKNNKSLTYSTIKDSYNGYALALPKNSALKEKINNALEELKKNGTLNTLINKWLEIDHA